MSEEEILGNLRQAVLNYDSDGARKAAEEAIKANVDPLKAIEGGGWRRQ